LGLLGPRKAFRGLHEASKALFGPLLALKGPERPYLGLKRPYCPAGGLLVPNKALWAKKGQERPKRPRKAFLGL